MRDASKKLYHIIGKVTKKYWKTSHKFRTLVPNTVDEALQIEKEMGNDFWRRSTEKEMLNI